MENYCSAECLNGDTPPACQDAQVRADRIGEIEEQAKAGGTLSRLGRISCTGAKMGLDPTLGFGCTAHIDSPIIADESLMAQAESVRLTGRALSEAELQHPID